MRRSRLLFMFFICLAALTALSGCITVKIPYSPGSPATQQSSPSPATVPQTPAIPSSPAPSQSPSTSYNPPAINYFAADPPAVTTGSYSSLSWSISNATTAYITPSIGAVPTSGRLPVQAPQTMTFTLQATGPGGSTSSTVTLVVSDHPVSVQRGDFTGTWQATPGSHGWDSSKIYLTQVGNTVTGTYDYQSGHIMGTVSGLTLTGNWSEEPTYSSPNDAGTFTVTLSADGSYFSGSWQYASSTANHSWDADRIR